jgi:hypothetical protein
LFTGCQIQHLIPDSERKNEKGVLEKVKAERRKVKASDSLNLNE